MRVFRYSKYLPWVLLYFFLNTPPGLPGGLFITSILSPLIYIWLLRRRHNWILGTYFAILFPFFLGALYLRANMKYFCETALLLMTVYVSCYGAAVIVHETRQMEKMFRIAIWGNLCLALLGLVVRFTSFYTLMWQNHSASGGHIIRYQGLSYEPAQFSLLIAPLFLFAYWHMVYRGWTPKNLRLAAAILFPAVISFSFGLLSTMTLGVILVHLVYDKGFNRVKWVVVIAVLALTAFIVIPADNSLKIRAISILNGTDSSENSRTTASYIAAVEEVKHSGGIIFGSGLGQDKVDVQYTVGDTGKIPCAVAATFAELGLMGLVLRFGLEIFFFIRTKPYRSAYRLCLFITMFIFQFGGSYIDNPVEYVTWILAFTPSLDGLIGPSPKEESEAEPESLYLPA